MYRCTFPLFLFLVISTSAFSQALSTDTVGLALCKEAKKHYANAQYILSAEKYEKACVIFKEKEDWDAFYNFQIGVIDSYYKLGYAEKVIEMVAKERENCAQRLGKNNALVGDYYFLEIKVNDRFEDGNRIPELAQKALEILIPTDGYKIGSIYNSLGIYWLLKKDYDQALANHNRGLAFKIRKIGADSGTVGVSYNNIGNVYDNLGDYSKAIEYFHKSLAVKIKNYGNQHPRVSNTYSSIGNTYAKKGEVEKAIFFYEKAIAIDRQSEDDPNRKLAFRYTSLSEAFLQTDRFDLAKKYGELSIAYYTKTKLNPIFSAAAFQNMGRVFGRQKEYGQAFPFYQKALAILATQALDETDLSNPMIEQRYVTERLFSVLREKMVTLDTWHKESPETFKLIAALNTSEVLIQTISLIQQDIETEDSKHLFLKDSREIFEKALSFCWELFETTGDPIYKEKALEIYEQSKAFLLRNILQNERAKNIANIPDSLRQQMISLKEDLNEIVFQIYNTAEESSKKELQSMLFNKTREYQLLGTELEKNFPKYAQMKGELAEFHCSTIQHSLKKEEAVFAWFVGTEQLFFFQITNFNFDFKRKERKPDFNTTISSFVQLLNDNLLADSKGNSKALYLDFSQQAQAIYQQLFPEDIVIPASVILVPDGILNLIPFEILLTGEIVNKTTIDYSTLPYLLKKAAIRYAYSLSLLIKPPKNQRDNKDEILAFAPNYFGSTNGALAARSGFSNLKYTQKEIKKISEIFTSENRIGTVATKENFKSLAQEYRFLHLAMHTITDDKNPSFSGLIFSEQASDRVTSTLYAYEIANMQLSADLVVLSACNTGIGKMAEGEGPISLARSFRQAGCPNVVMSLWQADDETTSILMADFYKNLKAGKGKAEALRQAKLSYLQQSRKNFPHYWAAFVLTGDNEGIALQNRNLLWWALGAAFLVLLGFVFIKKSTQFLVF